MGGALYDFASPRVTSTWICSLPRINVRVTGSPGEYSNRVLI